MQASVGIYLTGGHATGHHASASRVGDGRAPAQLTTGEPTFQAVDAAFTLFPRLARSFLERTPRTWATPTCKPSWSPPLHWHSLLKNRSVWERCHACWPSRRLRMQLVELDTQGGKIWVNPEQVIKVAISPNRTALTDLHLVGGAGKAVTVIGELADVAKALNDALKA